MAAYDLSESFVAVCGSAPDEVTGTKAAVVAQALRRLRAAGADLDGLVWWATGATMSRGAAAHDVPTIAVTWGYGTTEEWEQAAAVVRSPREPRRLLRPAATD